MVYKSSQRRFTCWNWQNKYAYTNSFQSKTFKDQVRFTTYLAKITPIINKKVSFIESPEILATTFYMLIKIWFLKKESNQISTIQSKTFREQKIREAIVTTFYMQNLEDK